MQVLRNLLRKHLQTGIHCPVMWWMQRVSMHSRIDWTSSGSLNWSHLQLQGWLYIITTSAALKNYWKIWIHGPYGPRPVCVCVCRRTSEHMRPEDQADHQSIKKPIFRWRFRSRTVLKELIDWSLVHSLNIDIFLLQPIPFVDDPLREEKASHIKVASGLLDLCCMSMTSCVGW